MQHLQHPYAWWPTLAVLVVATVTDIRSRRIPNWLVFPFLLSGLVVSTWVAGWHGLGESLGGMLLGGLIYGLLAMMGGMGMGDVKLCAAIGAWIWWKQLVFALVLIASGRRNHGACLGHLRRLSGRDVYGGGGFTFWLEGARFACAR